MPESVTASGKEVTPIALDNPSTLISRMARASAEQLTITGDNFSVDDAERFMVDAIKIAKRLKVQILEGQAAPHDFGSWQNKKSEMQLV